MNQNKIFLLFVFLSNLITPMEHVRRIQEASLDKLHENKDQKTKMLVRDYIAYKKSVDKTQLDRAQQEYEKSKGNRLTQAMNKLRSPQEGLLGTTVVKTENGYRKIAELKVGDAICSYDFKDQKEILSKVTYADKVHLKKHIQIVIDDQTIHVSPSHKFYIQPLNLWVTGSDIKNNINLRQLVDPNIKDVKEVKEPLEVIRITVDEKQNYFITDHNILVHNFIIVEGAVLWGAGEGAVITWAVLKPVLYGLGVLATSYFGNKVVNQNRAIVHVQSQKMDFDTGAMQRDIPCVERNPISIEKNTDQKQTPKISDNGGGTPSPQDPNKDNKDKDKKIPIAKPEDELKKEAVPMEKTMGGTKQFEKPGDYQNALKDFYRLNPSNVQEIPDKGMRGILSDGRSVNVRYKSSDQRPTLEIQNGNGNYVKFRYGSK